MHKARGSFMGALAQAGFVDQSKVGGRLSGAVQRFRLALCDGCWQGRAVHGRSIGTSVSCKVSTGVDAGGAGGYER
jgi:hypothetical protein